VREDSWPIYRPRRPRPRIDREHDETYRRIRAECEASELLARSAGRRDLAAAGKEGAIESGPQSRPD
jgi:hypothetical protein